MARPGPRRRSSRTSTPRRRSLRSRHTWPRSAPARPSRAAESTTPVGLSEEDLARGGELFRTNCSACHNFEGAGGALPDGKYAPPLMGVSNKHLYEAMLTGPQQMPVFSDEVLTARGQASHHRLPERPARAADRRRSGARRTRPGERGPVGLGPGTRRLDVALPSGSRRRGRKPMSTTHEQPAPVTATAAEVGNELAPRGAVPCSRPWDPKSTCLGSPTSTRRPPTGRPARWPPSSGWCRCWPSASPWSISRCREPLLRLRSAARQRPQSGPGPDVRAGAAVHRHRRHPVGAEADGRPGDGRLPARRSLQRRGAAWSRRRAGQGGRRVQDHPPQDHRSQPAGGPRHDLPADARRSCGPRSLADQEEASRRPSDDDLDGGCPAGPRRHVRADQARGHRDRSAGQR